MYGNFIRKVVDKLLKTYSFEVNLNILSFIAVDMTSVPCVVRSRIDRDSIWYEW